jgi:hypothetical protein
LSADRWAFANELAGDALKKRHVLAAEFYLKRAVNDLLANPPRRRARRSR